MNKKIIIIDLFSILRAPHKFWTAKEEAQRLVTRIRCQQCDRELSEDLTIFISIININYVFCHHKWGQIR